ncbi:hypothetical protein [Chromobacterium violaceum]|uniref:hypothetical protein n=1 Tax=Chromobacterium violaceum TaxID=536 RepID=UPI001125083F|nr:hypothetical protein [Chromobacterium violaceum]MBA8737439.1 hypothetical protein [Chromobacterium violaceum]
MKRDAICTVYVKRGTFHFMPTQPAGAAPADLGKRCEMLEKPWRRHRLPSSTWRKRPRQMAAAHVILQATEKYHYLDLLDRKPYSWHIPFAP